MPDFTFNAKGHYYELDGKRLHGVTTVLGVIAKPMLIGWAAKQTAEWIRENCDTLVQVNGKGTGGQIYQVNEEYLQEAVKAHTKKKEAAGEKGTDVHAEVEKYIKACIAGEPFEGSNEPMAQTFIEWAKANEVKFTGSECRMYSEKYWLAGTCDFTCEMKGKKYLADLKTSSAFYPEHFYQCAAYRLMMEERGENFDGSLIVKIDKKTGKLETQERYDYETDKAAFLGALAIHKANATY